MNAISKISIIGGGSWGTALGLLLKSNGHSVSIWDANPAILDCMKNKGMHPSLKGLTIENSAFNYIYNLDKAFDETEFLITVIPSQEYYSFWDKIRDKLNTKIKIINCSKGIDVKTNKFISDLLRDRIPDFPADNYSVLSGPSYASEVINKIPTAVVSASQNIDTARAVQKLFCNKWFRVYTNTDITGVELAGAVKNVIAIASGITSGIGYGINTQAALITRGNAEIIRLGLKLGARPETFNGLAGIGDLMLTGLSEQSRNFSFGKLIGQGNTIEAAKSKINTVIEGIETVKSTKNLAKKHMVVMPIVEKVYQILFENFKPLDAVNELMTRDLKSE